MKESKKLTPEGAKIVHAAAIRQLLENTDLAMSERAKQAVIKVYVEGE